MVVGSTLLSESCPSSTTGCNIVADTTVALAETTEVKAAAANHDGAGDDNGSHGQNQEAGVGTIHPHISPKTKTAAATCTSPTTLTVGEWRGRAEGRERESGDLYGNGRVGKEGR